MKKGYTLMHEHITIDLSGIKNDEDCRLDCFEESQNELCRLYELGVRRILDVTNMGMGRNSDYCRLMEENTGIQILSATGFYKEPFLPEFVYTMSVRELARLAIKEISEGIENTGIKASVIGEFGTSKDTFTEMERKVFDSMALAAVQTGAVVTTHTTLGTMALEQAEYLKAEGVKPENIIIGHLDLSQNPDTIISVLKEGVNIGFDTVGKNNYCPDTFRAQMLKRIAKEGYLDQVVLSMDITRKSHLKKWGGPGYAYLFETFLPMLQEYGLSEKQIEQLMIDNPNRILKQEA
ncbi:phosphotriesterase family protein [Lacrimispora sp. AGF001]|jgi:phosphotriesterase-related protein|uniref:phosphotriesterase family protein n=1 Tax=Lacrimispora sp. AGF001 TaxID=3401631 RepID=UPI003B42A2C8